MAQDQMRDECKDLFAEFVESQTKANYAIAMLEVMMQNHMRHIKREVGWLKWIMAGVLACVIAIVVQ